jgi:hypothetical protein
VLTVLFLTYRASGGRSILPVYDPARLSGDAPEPVKGGRVHFSTWARHIKNLPAERVSLFLLIHIVDLHICYSNAIGAILFKEAAPNYINLSRVSPIRLSSQVSSGSSATRRLQVDGRVAVCVSAVFTTESYLGTAHKIGPNSDRTRKWVSGIVHNQEWERMESILCLVLNEPVLYAQLTPKNALSFQTMMSPANTPSSRRAFALLFFFH